MNNKNNKNILSIDRYLISPELQRTLKLESSIRYDELDLLDSKNQNGVCLVKLSRFNNDSNVIIYNYIYYPSVFKYVLTYYLITRWHFRNSLIYKEWGDYFTIFDKNVLELRDQDLGKLDLNPGNRYLISALGSGVDIQHEIGSFQELFIFINKLNYCITLGDMASLIDLAFVKDYKGFVGSIFDGSSNYKLGGSTINWELIEDCEDTEDFAILPGCLFVVSNLSQFINNIKDKGYIVNEGPQKLRGHVNSMNNFLNILDIDFRNSLYRHNLFHSHSESLNHKLRLDKKNFSYRNIHQNISGIRWFSSVSSELTAKNVVKSRSIVIKKKSLSENSPIYNYLYDWLSKSPINVETQEALERYLLDYTYISIDNKEKNPLIDYSLISSKLARLLYEKKTSLSSILNNFRTLVIDINKKKVSEKDIARYYFNILLKEISNEEVIAIIYGRLMRIISRHDRLYSDNDVLDIFQDIAENLIKDYTFSLYYKHIKSLCLQDDKFKILDSESNNAFKLQEQQFIRSVMKSYTLTNWNTDNSDIVNIFKDITLKSYIGGAIVEWMVECDLIKNRVVSISQKEKRSVYIPTDEVLSCLGDRKLVNLPFRLPMLVKPKPYYREDVNGVVTERLGGYLLNDIKTTDSMIIDNWELKESAKIQEQNIVYGLVNNMNSVGYKVNKDVLDFIYKYGIDYDLIIYKDSPLLNKPYLRKMEKLQLESYQNKLELQENILGIAKVYSNVAEFYLPVRVDNRLRMYCISEYLNYQSTELAKALLVFSRGEKIRKTDIRAINYLKAFGANCFGNKLDKKSWNERTKWVDDNVKEIINFHNGKLIKQASNKLLFIAFCFEYNRFIKSLNNVETTYFETYLPVQLDATCNGYQHLSLLSLDLSLAKELNLVTSSWNDVPKDFYNYLSSNLIDYFKNKLKSTSLSEEDMENYERLSNLQIQRTIVKKVIMTIPYNVSTHQMINYIRDNFELIELDPVVNNSKERWYQFIEDSDVKLKNRDFTTIALGLKEVLRTNFFKLKELMSYLKETAKICTKLELVIPWVLPSGVVVIQSYLSSNEVRLRPFSYSKSKFSIKVVDKSKFNSRKQIRAFMPNLVHSLDAASLALLVDMLFNNNDNKSVSKNMYAIHDCFAVTANNMESVMELLKLVYMKIYSDGKYLKELDKEIRHQIIVHYGNNCFIDNTTIKIPEIGKLKYPDINRVLGLKLPEAHLDTRIIESSSYIIN